MINLRHPQNFRSIRNKKLRRQIGSKNVGKAKRPNLTQINALCKNKFSESKGKVTR